MMEDQSHHLRRAETEELRKENEQLKKSLASAEWCRDYQAERRADKVEEIIDLKKEIERLRELLKTPHPKEEILLKSRAAARLKLGIVDNLLSPRIEELVRRMVASGPKCAYISASETHEICDAVLAARRSLKEAEEIPAMIPVVENTAGGIGLTWTSNDKVLSLELLGSKFTWFFRDRATGETDGTNDIDAKITPGFYKRMRELYVR